MNESSSDACQHYPVHTSLLYSTEKPTSALHWQTSNCKTNCALEETKFEAKQSGGQKERARQREKYTQYRVCADRALAEWQARENCSLLPQKHDASECPGKQEELRLEINTDKTKRRHHGIQAMFNLPRNSDTCASSTRATSTVTPGNLALESRPRNVLSLTIIALITAYLGKLFTNRLGIWWSEGLTPGAFQAELADTIISPPHLKDSRVHEKMWK